MTPTPTPPTTPRPEGLLPCPFCGSGYVRIMRITATGEKSVICYSCGGETAHKASDEEAVAAWNQRAIDHLRASLAPRPVAEKAEGGDAWTDEDAKKPWGCEVAALRHLADDPALGVEKSALLRHCAKRIEATAQARTDSLVEAARKLVEAVDHNHDTKSAPMRYTVPWSEVVALREALAAAPAPAPSDPSGEWVRVPKADFDAWVDALESLKDTAEANGDRYNVAYIGKMVEHADAWIASSPSPREPAAEPAGVEGVYAPRYVADGPGGMFGTDDLAFARRLCDLIDPGCSDWTITDTHDPDLDSVERPAEPAGVSGLVEKWRAEARLPSMSDDITAARAAKRVCADELESALASQPAGGEPIPMLLFCPKCQAQHVDAPDDRTADWTNPPHRSHLCHACGCIWRPADVATVGVATIATKGKADTWDGAAPVGGTVSEAMVEAAMRAYYASEFDEPDTDIPYYMKNFGNDMRAAIAAALAAKEGGK